MNTQEGGEEGIFNEALCFFHFSANWQTHARIDGEDAGHEEKARATFHVKVSNLSGLNQGSPGPRSLRTLVPRTSLEYSKHMIDESSHPVFIFEIIRAPQLRTSGQASLYNLCGDLFDAKNGTIRSRI